MTTRTAGIHHVTAIARDPQRNLDFHVGVLGLRLVKQTVNFDDPGTWHFYFANGAGTPGSVLTFFPWPHARQGRRGSGEVSATAFAVGPGSLDWWGSRLDRLGVAHGAVERRRGQRLLALADPDGMRLELVEDADSAPPRELDGDLTTAIPNDHALRGFHSVTLTVAGHEATARLIVDFLGFEAVDPHDADAGDPNRHRFMAASPRGTPGRIVDLICAPEAPAAALGGGSVHHVALRTTDADASTRLRERLVSAAFNVTPILDRRYFQSLYLREPGGVIVELATDPPGFAIDEASDALGSALMLPPWLEPRRVEIAARLPPVSIPSVLP